MIRSSLLDEMPGVMHAFLDRAPPETPARWWPGVGGTGPVPLVRLQQVHGARVWWWRPGIAWQPLPEGDAVVTAHAGSVLAVKTADCVPILLAGPGVVAAVHAGWRGTAVGVVSAALEMMREAMPVAGPLRAALGPAIGSCCYQVGEEVVEALADRIPRDVFLVRSQTGPHVDLRLANAWLLRRQGVQTDVSFVCTCCGRDSAGRFLLHSHRRDGAGAGRQYACISLRP